MRSSVSMPNAASANASANTSTSMSANASTQESQQSWTPLPYGDVLQGCLLVSGALCIAYIPAVWALQFVCFRQNALSWSWLIGYIVLNVVITSSIISYIVTLMQRHERRDSPRTKWYQPMVGMVWLIVALAVGLALAMPWKMNVCSALLLAAISFLIECWMTPQDESTIPTREQIRALANDTGKPQPNVPEAFADEIKRFKQQQKKRRA